jgi:hypothetical protein
MCGMMSGLLGNGMMWGMGIALLLGSLLALLAIAALSKYVFSL